MAHRVRRRDVRLQVQLQIVERGERQARNHVIVQLVHHALHNRLIYAVERSLDFLFGLGREAKSVPIFTVQCVVGRVVGDKAGTTGE